MKYFINLKIEDLSIQSLSYRSEVKEGSVQVEFDLESTDGIGTVLTQSIKDSLEFKLVVVRALRNKLLTKTIWISERHLSQLTEDRNLSAEDYTKWQTYWQELRDLPELELPDTLVELLTILPTKPV